MSKDPKKNKASEKPSLMGTKCLDCREEILQRDPQKCPYCGSTNLISKKDDVSSVLAEIEQLKKAGQYEDAAQKYEELEMWDMANETRNMNMGKVSAINMTCPHCGTSQPLSSKVTEVTCKSCGKKYGVPKKVLDVL
jgi:transposase-like protein